MWGVLVLTLTLSLLTITQIKTAGTIESDRLIHIQRVEVVKKQTHIEKHLKNLKGDLLASIKNLVRKIEKETEKILDWGG